MKTNITKPIHPDESEQSSGERLIVGRFGSPFGVQGWLKVNSYTRPSSNILNYVNWQVYYQNEWQIFSTVTGKQQGDQIIVRLPHCNDRDIASTYTNCEIAVLRSELPPLASDEYYWSDLVGLQVINHDGTPLGYIESFLETPANDIFMVKGDKRRLLPYTDDIVQSIDMEKKQMIVVWDVDF